MDTNDRKFNTEDEVIIIQINNERAKHLEKFVGSKGSIISWIKVGKEYRYKVLIDGTQDHHYFLENEIKLASVDK